MGVPIVRKVIDLLPPEERWKLLALLAAMLATGVMQALGLASVMPFIGLVANPNLVNENAWMTWAFDTLGFTTTRQFLFFMGIAVVVFFTAGNALAALTSWFSYRFVWYNHQKIAERLLDEYLSKPYSFFLGRHGARLSKTLLSEVKTVLSDVIMPGLDVVSKAISTLLVVALLVLVDPWIAAIVSVGLGCAYALIYLLVRRKQKRLGERQVAANTAMYRVANEAFGGIKDVKVLGREAAMVARFRAPAVEFAAARASNAIVRQLPSYALESIATGGMLAVLLYLLQVRESLDQVLPLIALYTVAGNRLMPAFHQIFAGLTAIRFNTAVLDELHADIAGRSRPVNRPSVTVRTDGPRGVGSEIRFQGVSFEYPRARRTAVKNVDMVIQRNATVGLVGSTGSGKTTLVDLLLGLFTPTTGEILIDGQRLDDSTMAAWRSRVGYVPQAIFLCDDTIARNIAFGIPDDGIDHDAVERAARAANLHGFISRLSDGYSTIVGERGVRLSGGERQRIGIARALYHEPDVLVLDEATSALDTVTEDAVMQATRDLARNRTIVLIAHRLSTVKHCDAIVLLEGGEVVARGTYDELTATNASFRAMAGLR